MAQKRMFDKSIVRRDDFMEMPISTQNLYFHLSLDADDDGFVNNWKSILKITSCKEDDLKLLISKQFVIPFESGVIVIKHWRINNILRSDRYHETKYLAEKSLLNTGENQEYTLGIPMVYQLAPEYSIEENSIEENRIEENRIEKNNKEKDVVFKKELAEIYNKRDTVSIPYAYTMHTTVSVSDTISNTDIITDIINYMNNILNTNYKSTTESTKRFIRARLNEGFTLEQFKKVIDKKYNEWGQDKTMSKFLRPETLFGTKFESYLNQQDKNKATTPEWLGKDIESTIDKTENKEFKEFIEEFRKVGE